MLLLDVNVDANVDVCVCVWALGWDGAPTFFEPTPGASEGIDSGTDSGGNATPSEGGKNPGGGALIAEGAVRE